MDNKWITKCELKTNCIKVEQRTIIFGMDENIGKCLDEVGKVISQKFRTENDIFSGECRAEGTAE